MRSLKAGPLNSLTVKPADTNGRLVYAVGDVHGRADLLDALIVKILQDVDFAETSSRPVLVFLGDYVDRGPDSRLVIDRVLSLQGGRAVDVKALKGNHEEAFLLFLKDASFGPTWMVHGGGPTLASYGVQPPMSNDPEAWIRAQEHLQRALPEEHRRFLLGLELYEELGDYIFVHAGVRPGVAMSRQSERDLLWIRQDFLSAERPGEQVVVHGHTPEERPFSGTSRIGVDTGAYATGVLTAVRLYGATRTFIQAAARLAERRSERPRQG